MELIKICKSFDGNIILDDVSLLIPKGSRVLITAPSGRGKTTLLRIMMGLLPPDSGSVVNRPARQAAVFQEDRLPEEFTAVNSVKMTCRRGVSKQLVREHLAEVGLAEHLEAEQIAKAVENKPGHGRGNAEPALQKQRQTEHAALGYSGNRMYIIKTKRQYCAAEQYAQAVFQLQPGYQL